MPTLPQMAASFTDESFRWAMAGFPITSPIAIEQRHAICNACDAYEHLAFGSGRCKSCGCLSVKAKMATAQCKLDLWGGEEALRPGLLRYDIQDAICEHYRNRTPNPSIEPSTIEAWRMVKSGLCRPALRLGITYPSDSGLEKWNPLRWDTLPNTTHLMARYHEAPPGPGHVIQRLCVANGLFPDAKPRGCIVCVRDKVKKRVAVSASGAVLASIEQTLATMGMEAVRVPEGFTEAVAGLAAAQWFIGADGDGMHIAAALGVRSIIVVERPVVLPVLVPLGDGSEWLYPQNVHLNNERDTLLCPMFTPENVALAMAGKVYPFGSDAYLTLTPD